MLNNSWLIVFTFLKNDRFLNDVKKTKNEIIVFIKKNCAYLKMKTRSSNFLLDVVSLMTCLVLNDNFSESFQIANCLSSNLLKGTFTKIKSVFNIVIAFFKSLNKSVS